ncbi:MAG: zinc-binding dehydrogenase, partial [Acidimicrobiaceae bacterium]|nr:zinc-binding dehydrogenase [Acidimicrobiaceae bacterium]
LARHDGVRVIGTASPRHHDSLRRLGVEPLDYHSADLSRQIRELAPDGVAAVFDNIGGDSFRRSFDLLADGGTLVGFGTASQRDDADNQLVTFARILSSFAAWSLRSKGRRRATFYNFWGGSRTRPVRFQRRLAEDLGELLKLLSAGAIEPIIAGRYTLEEAPAALRFAEERSTQGKVVILGQTGGQRWG